MDAPATSSNGIAARVSVIMPAFNCAAFIGEAIESALAQTVAPFEIIIVDDGSSDGTADAVAAHGDRVTLIRQRNQGVAAARNAALRAARGEFVAFLDADDAWAPRKLEVQLACMARHPDMVLLGTETFAWPASETPRCDGARIELRDVGRDDLAVRNYLTTSSVLVRSSAIERAGAFDIELRGPEDHDYWLRLAECGRVAIARAPLTGYRAVPGSLSRRAQSMEAGMRRILAKLDARDFWRGRSLLRRRAYSYVSCSAAQLYGAAGDQQAAMRRLLGSMVWYPLPYTRAEAGVAMVRPKRLAVALLRMIGLKRPDPGC